MRLLGVVIVMAACAPPQARPVGVQPWGARIVSTMTTVFAGDVSERIDDKEIVTEFGGGHQQTIALVRAGKVVCSVDGGGRFRGCVGGTRSSASLELRSTQPIRFVVQRNDGLDPTLLPHRRCTGYELLATGTCRQVFERSCPADDCTYAIAVSQTPGRGQLILNAKRDGRADPGAHVFVDPPMATRTDDRGVAELAVTPGLHEATIDESFIGSVEQSFELGPLEDTTLDLEIRCNCCAF